MSDMTDADLMLAVNALVTATAQADYDAAADLMNEVVEDGAWTVTRALSLLAVQVAVAQARACAMVEHVVEEMAEAFTDDDIGCIEVRLPVPEDFRQQMAADIVAHSM